MNTRKTIHKVYLAWDFKKEELWLNEMAAEGWALEHAAFCSYTFVRCEPGEYIIRMEMNADRDYRSFVEETGAEYVGGCVNWIYFRRKAELGSFDLFSDIDSRIAHLARIGKSLWLICPANRCCQYHRRTDVFHCKSAVQRSAGLWSGPHPWDESIP